MAKKHEVKTGTLYTVTGEKQAVKDYIFDVMHREDFYLYQTRDVDTFVWSDTLYNETFLWVYGLQLPEFVCKVPVGEDTSKEPLPDVNLEEIMDNVSETTSSEN